MITGESLHKLIKSLTSSEKRAFTIQTTIQSGDKNYLLLFELLDEMDSFSEESLLQALSEKKIDFNLLSAQSYLQQKILDTLCYLSEQEITDARLNKFLFEAQILEKRGFFELADEILDKAQRLATKYHKHYHLIEILRQKGNLISKLSTKNIAQEIENVFNKALDSTQVLKQQLEYDYLTNWLYAQTVVKRYYTNTNIHENVNRLTEPLLSKEISKNESFYVQYLYYKSWALYYYTQQKLDKSTESYIKILEIWEKFPEMKKEEQRKQ